MAQFDAYRDPNGGEVLLLDVQAELLSELETRVVIPLVPAARLVGYVVRSLTPVFVIDGNAYRVLTTSVAAVPRRELRSPIANLADRRADILAALALLFTGA